MESSKTFTIFKNLLFGFTTAVSHREQRVAIDEKIQVKRVVYSLNMAFVKKKLYYDYVGFKFFVKHPPLGSPDPRTTIVA